MNDEPAAPTFPEGIGPHEGRELELMLAGKKPLAMFSEAIVVPVSDLYPEEDFLPHVKSGTLIRREKIYPNPKHPIDVLYVYYALPGEEWRIDRMHQIQTHISSGSFKWAEEHEWEVGRLLGYSDKDIQTFIEWLKSKVPFK